MGNRDGMVDPVVGGTRLKGKFTNAGGLGERYRLRNMTFLYIYTIYSISVC
jgi:hypothetical protein